MNSKIKILVDDKEIDYYEFADELRKGDYFFKENGKWYLHKRPTIIEEDKKIEQLQYAKYRQDKIIDKINEIIDYINKENK